MCTYTSAVQWLVLSSKVCVFVSVYLCLYNCVLYDCICAASGLHSAAAAWVLGCQVKSGLCIPPLSPFCSGRPENCTQFGSAHSLCAFVYFVFAYEFRPSHIMAYKLLLLEYKSYQQITHHTVEKMLYPHIVHGALCVAVQVCKWIVLATQCTSRFAPWKKRVL